MADERPAPDAETLIATKNDLVDRVTEQQRKFGMLPDVRAAESFIVPIMRKVEVDQAADRLRDHHREPAAPRRPRRDMAPGFERFEIPVGAYAFGAPGKGLVPLDGAPESVMLRKERPATAAARECFRRMTQIPEWRDRVETIALSTMTLSQREIALRKVLTDWVRLFGDPRKKKDRRIVVASK